MTSAADIASSLSRTRGLVISESAGLAGLTTWKVGGPADVLIRASTASALNKTMRVVREAGIPVMVLGRGSNVLVADEGFRGAVIHLEGELANVRVRGESVEAGGGAALSEVVKQAAAASLSGMEFAFGIPGTVGGAVMTNAGTFSGSTAGALSTVTCITPGGDERVFDGLEGGYREQLVPEGCIVTTATFGLQAADMQEIEQAMELVKARRASQPAGATAGSVFKNPPGDSAGRLLDDCGLKGYRLGGAQVAEAHANFIVNRGGATAEDIFGLMARMAEEVKARHGIELEPEVVLVGFDKEM